MLQRRKRFFANDADDEVPNSQDTRLANKRRRGNKGKDPEPIQREDIQQDELDTYLVEPVVNSKAYLNDPIAWWRDIGAKRFPKLSYMAVNFLTIPSAAAETERQFSSVGQMVSARRSCLQRHVIGASQCIRSWSKAGVYKAELPLELLDRASSTALQSDIARELTRWAQRS